MQRGLAQWSFPSWIAQRFETPIDVFLVLHRLINERVELRVIGLERLARSNGPVGVMRGLARAGTVEIGFHARRPVADARACGRRAFPAPPVNRLRIDLLKLA